MMRLESCRVPLPKASPLSQETSPLRDILVIQHIYKKGLGRETKGLVAALVIKYPSCFHIPYLQILGELAAEVPAGVPFGHRHSAPP